jgi:hypothetical protein
MTTTCTRCDNTGFLNIDQIGDWANDKETDEILEWSESNEGHDVQVCDCCGNGENWYGIPGEHYSNDDPVGVDGPYAYNGGRCECH